VLQKQRFVSAINSRQVREALVLRSSSVVRYANVFALGHGWVKFHLLAGLGRFVGGSVDFHVDCKSRFGLGSSSDMDWSRAVPCMPESAAIFCLESWKSGENRFSVAA
jgi:hypothetical protein